MKVNKSKLFKIAWAIIKKSEATTFSDALRKAWKAEKIIIGMLIGKVEFVFRKLNGEVRKAIGTLTGFDYTPSGKVKSEEEKKRNMDVILFYDVEKKAFRSFKASTLI